MHPSPSSLRGQDSAAPTTTTATATATGPPDTSRWPVAVRSAERLRGSLLRCGPGSRGIGWPDTPRVRLAVLSHAIGGDHIVIGRSAAWVWGTLREHGARIECSTRDRRRPPHGARSGLRLRQLELPAQDVVTLGASSVTTPVRTASDLLRDRSNLRRSERIAVRLLALAVAGGRSAIGDHLRAGPRAGRVLALARWNAL